MNRFAWVGSALLITTVVGTGASLAAWKYESIRAADAAAARQPEPAELVTAAVSRTREHRPTTTSIGTVLALRSIGLRNELPGTVRDVSLTPGQIVEAGTLLVALDVSVEQAELEAHRAQAALAQTMLERVQRLGETQAVAESEVDRALAERDVALAQIERIKAIIVRKSIRAPFRARVGLADLHPGQYLEEGTLLTTLQGVEDAVHVDFSVSQQVAEALEVGQGVEVFAGGRSGAGARIVATDARIDPATRNAMVRARVEDAPDALSPGASVRVHIPVGPLREAVAVPVSALRKGPAGSHVYVIAQGGEGESRARLRPVDSGEVLGDEVLIHAGLSAGERVATSGSFKLRDGALVAIANDPASLAARMD